MMLTGVSMSSAGATNGLPPKLTKLPTGAESLASQPSDGAQQTDFSDVASFGYTFRECARHTDGSACDPYTETAFKVDSKWVRTDKSEHPKAIGTLTTQTTSYTTSGMAATATGPAPVVANNVGPPTHPGFTPSASPAPRIAADGSKNGGCCSPAGYGAVDADLSYQVFWGEPSFSIHARQVWWWGGGTPGVAWGIVLPYGSSLWFTHLDGYAYQDGGYGTGRYEWYDYLGRGAYTGFLWWPTRIVHACIFKYGCAGDLYPTFHFYVHNDGSWWVSWWSR